MPFGGLLTFGIGTGIAGLTSFLAGRRASSAAESASDAQAAAAAYAADLNFQAGREANALQLGIYDQQRQDQAPWQEAGIEGLGTLRKLLQPGGELAQNFQAPAPFDPSKVQMDPGYDFRMREGQKALERSAAARGGALGGGSMRALARYGSDLASQEYGAAYGRAASEYDRNFTNAFNVFNTNQGNKFNRLASLAGVGQTAVNTLANAGTNYSNMASGAILDTGARSADLATQAGNARASGYIGAGNAWQDAVGGFNQVLGQGIGSLLNRRR